MDHLTPASTSYRNKQWNPLKAVYPAPRTDEPRVLGYGGRDDQLRCFDKFHEKRKTLFISPTGSGKSLLQVFCAAREIIESDWQQKQIFIVPQLNIGNGFSGDAHPKINYNGKIYEWEITTNCCKG